MVRKTVKDLDEEIDELRNVMVDVKRMVEEIYKKCENLENEGVRVVDENVHKNETGSFECRICKRMFIEEWKLRAHEKNHSGFKCDECDKNFRLEEVLGKHVKIHHENVKLYCHFFNNEKDCPYGVNCVFLHEPSSQCKYGNLCERNYCMFKHVMNIAEDEGAERWVMRYLKWVKRYLKWVMRYGS